jgi:nitrogen fixation/metabolism regulation signal transduction histidine kinase
VSPLIVASSLGATAVMGFLLLRARKALALSVARQAALLDERRENEAKLLAPQELLRAVVEATPVAILVFADSGPIRFTNAAARELFFDGAEVEGQNFLAMLAHAPEPVRRALLAVGDELFSVEGAGGETFHLSKRYFSIAGEPHTLVAVKHLTQEIARQEIGTLKKVIRVISHELNNSLGPIQSLVESGRMIVKRPEHLPRLDGILSTVEERAQHLIDFLAGYAQLAKLPAPRLEVVDWKLFLESIRALWPGVAIGAAPTAAASFDVAQIQQVLINLIKNASEAGGPPDSVELRIERADGGTLFSVLDRGSGLSDEALHSAILPFFTTKPKGSGLGLALSREIVESHQGRLRLARREGGGAEVSFWLPDRASVTGAASTVQARLRLTAV